MGSDDAAPSRELVASFEPRRVTAVEARSLVERSGYVLVDVRGELEFLAAHPVGAKNVPLAFSEGGRTIDNTEALLAIERLAPERARVVLVCGVGRATQTLARKLVHAGYADVVDVVGGVDGLRDAFGSMIAKGWRGLGLPLAHGEDEGSWRSLRAILGFPAEND